MPSTLTPSAPLIQGVPSPDVVVDPPSFYANTRRLTFPMRALTTITGIGSQETVPLLQTGIVSALEVRVTGSVVFGGTIGTTTMSYEWPFNLATFRLSANGQSQLVNATGLHTRALEFAGSPSLTDRGLSKSYAGSTVTQGTLALSSDDWGTSSSNVMAPGTNVAATGTYSVDLTYIVPVAADPVSLIGSVYAQSAATNLNLEIQWNTQNGLISALGGSATVTFAALQYSVTGVVYSIPNVGGKYVIPDLSNFHQFTSFRTGGLASGVNEVQLPGVGVGRKLLRVLGNVYSGSTPAPLALNDTNFSTVGWRYGGSDTPEQYSTGQPLRARNERQTGVDLGKNWGIHLWDFASQFALRDVVDEGSTSNLRFLYGLVSSPTSGYSITSQETLFAAPVGA